MTSDWFPVPVRSAVKSCNVYVFIVLDLSGAAKTYQARNSVVDVCTVNAFKTRLVRPCFKCINSASINNRIRQAVSDIYNAEKNAFVNHNETRMWANAQPDGRPAKYRWRPLFNAAKFG